VDDLQWLLAAGLGTASCRLLRWEGNVPFIYGRVFAEA
jgi:hypothetical protein